VKDCDVRVMVGDAVKLASLESVNLEAAFYKGDEPPPASVKRRTRSLRAVLKSSAARPASRTVLESDLAAILYTSGSTGFPKGVALSHHNLVVGAQLVSSYLGNTSEDRILSALPFGFDYGLSQLTTSLRVGAALVLQRSSLSGDLIRDLREHRITGLAGVPPLWPLLLRSEKALEERPLEYLRYITNSGGRVPQSRLDALRRCLPSTDIYLMYGLTEAFRSTYLPPQELYRGSGCMGKPIPNTEVWVLDPSGRECEPGKVGELVHRGPTVALGYWGEPEASRRVFRSAPFTQQGLPIGEKAVYSGDMVRRDEDGYLHFVGREDQLIKTQGYRLSPEEVEDVLLSAPAVLEACAFGVRDPEAGERVVAVVSLLDGGEGALESVRAFVQQNAPHYMAPKEIIVTPELPRTSSGKLDRKVIRDAYSDR